MKSLAKMMPRLFLLATVGVLFIPSLVSAQLYSDGVGGMVGYSYFQNAYVGRGGNFDWIYPFAHGSYSSIGSVMPNWQRGSTASGGGAVGTKALGVADSEIDSQVLKQALYNYLYKSNTNQLHGANTPAGRWDRMGSAVSVHAMLGEDFTNPGRKRNRTISQSEWDELKSKLVDNTNIEMKRELYPARINTSGIMVGDNYDIFDAARYTFDDGKWKKEDSWVFRDKTGKVVYAMEIICANPLGDLEGLPDSPPPPPPEPEKEYNLVPTADSNNMSSVAPGGEIKVDGKVKNIGKDPSPGNEWRLIEVVYEPGVTPGPKGDDNTTDPCVFFKRGNPPCKEVASGNNAFPVAIETVVKDDYVYNVPETAKVGTKVCFALSVRPPTQADGDTNKWRHSDLHCVTVSKSPKIQVWGGDVRSGGKIDTSVRSFKTPALTFGSWSEYGALSSKVNSGFASGAGLNNGGANSSQSTWSNLTFANTGASGGSTCNFGCYNFSLGSSSLVNQFVSQPSMPSLSGRVDLNTLASGTYRANNVRLSDTTVSPGKSIILVATGTVTIEGSISYQDVSYTNIKDIPQVIIKASTINIRGGATQVDAWLLAVSGNGTGVINTCSDVAITDKLSSNLCSNKLTINGPVVADTIYLRRTAGSDSQPDQRGEPAEVFNLRADAYLWANAHGSGGSSVQTVYTKELSPRF